MRPYVTGENPAKRCGTFQPARALIAEAGRITATELSIAHVAAAYQQLNNARYAASTRNVTVTGLRKMLRSLVAHGAPYGLEKAAPPVPRAAPRPNTLQDDAIASLLALARPHMRLFILLCHDCALRSGTAAELRWVNLPGDGEQIVIRSKRATVVRVPTSLRIRELLARCPKDDGPLIGLMTGKEQSAAALRIQFAKLVSKAGLPKDTRLHDLRRTMAEKAYRLTSDLRVVQTLLGHDAIQSTLHYLQRPAQASMEELTDALEVLTNAKA